jgi:glycosyltransferase involved in cell wall biosynthesis
MNEKAIAVGRLVYEKGFDYLIEAWALVAEKYPSWELNIYGNGNQKNILNQLIKNKNLEKRIHICEPESNIQEKYREHSMLIFPTRFLDSFGMVIIEAMSLGLPVISFDAPCGPKDLITDGVNGFLVKTGDIYTLSEKIIRLIETESLRIRMGKAAREFSGNFHTEKVMERWVHLFEFLRKQYS